MEKIIINIIFIIYLYHFQHKGHKNIRMRFVLKIYFIYLNMKKVWKKYLYEKKIFLMRHYIDLLVIKL